MLLITALAAALLGLQYFRLSLKVIGFRHKLKVSIGAGGHDQLERAIRSQANLTEYAPIALIMLACLELNGAPLWLVAPIAIAFVAGRILHPLGMSAGAGTGAATTSIKPRVLGMHLTLWSIVLLAVSNILLIVWQLFSA